jgi:DNA gyrase subunit A
MSKDENLIPVYIEDELKESYLTYAMSVIVSRALPDVRDGLKPVHRRILYSMFEQGNTHDKPHVKCARIVGYVMGNYHPHGDAAIYNTLVRLAQDFSMRHPLVDGQGNFGSVDGDPPAAMRYTESKMQKITAEMLKDLKKDTVDWLPNYDDTKNEPVVLPAGFPNLLVNGSSGIAVGMATNIPPHNLGEILDATCAYIDNHEITIQELMKYVKGPDFPTSSIIYGQSGIKRAFKTGRGRVTVRAKVEIEEVRKGKEAIIVTEIPYQVNKADLIINIADLVKNKKIEGISDLRDESSRDGMRIVIEIKKDHNIQTVLNLLFVHTALQSYVNYNMLALVSGEPKLLNLKEILEYYVAHRKEIIIRRTKYDLKKAEERAHILEGLLIAIDNIDEVIEIIRNSDSTKAAKERLMERFELSDIQAQAILDMQLKNIVRLESQRLQEEYDALMKLIKELNEILASEERQYLIIKDELMTVKAEYANKRLTEIKGELGEFDAEDLIVEESVAVTISENGFIKRLPVNTYKKQKRGGKGVKGAGLTEGADEINHLYTASTHDYIMFFTNKGKTFYIKVHEIPEGSRTGKGRSIKLLLNLSSGEEVKTVLPVKTFEDNSFIILGTKNGIVKKVKIEEFVNAKARGIIGIAFDKDDELVSAVHTDGKEDVMVCTRGGYALRFSNRHLRPMGRNARGVKGISLKKDDEVSGFIKIVEDKKLLVISDYGLGKYVDFKHFTRHGRGTGGQIYMKCTEKSGKVAVVHPVSKDDDIYIITSRGMMVKLDASEIKALGRTATGVTIVNISDDDCVSDVTTVDKED